jgi:hypothetical protein
MILVYCQHTSSRKRLASGGARVVGENSVYYKYLLVIYAKFESRAICNIGGDLYVIQSSAASHKEDLC